MAIYCYELVIENCRLIEKIFSLIAGARIGDDTHTDIVAEAEEGGGGGERKRAIAPSGSGSQLTLERS